MAEQHIIIADADTQDDVYPMAWSVRGGDGTFGNVNIAPANGSSTANVNINNGKINIYESNIAIGSFNSNMNYYGNNANIATKGNLGLTTTDSNSFVEVGGPGSVSIIPGGNILLSTGSNISLSCGSNILLGCGGSITIGSGSGETRISAGAGVLTLQGGSNGMYVSSNNVNASVSNVNATISNINLTGGNFNVGMGQTNFAYPVTFNSPATFNSLANINGVMSINNTSYSTCNLNTNLAYANISTAHTNHSDVQKTYVNRKIDINAINPSIRTYGNSKIRGTINTDKTVFTNLQYMNSAASYTYTNSFTSSSFSFGTIDTLNLLATVPITDTINVSALDDNTVVQANLSVTAIIVGTDDFVTLYVELYNNDTSTHYPITLLDAESKAGTDFSATLPTLFLKDLIDNSVTQLDSNWQFLVYANPNFTPSATGTVTCTTTIKLFEPLTAGTGGGGGTVNDTNLYLPYNSATTYNKNDMVKYNDILYKCVVPVTSPEAFDSNKWINTVLSNEVTDNINALGGLSLVKMNSATYANLPSYDSNILYVVKD